MSGMRFYILRLFGPVAPLPVLVSVEPDIERIFGWKFRRKDNRIGFKSIVDYNVS